MASTEDVVVLDGEIESEIIELVPAGSTQISSIEEQITTFIEPDSHGQINEAFINDEALPIIVVKNPEEEFISEKKEEEWELVRETAKPLAKPTVMVSRGTETELQIEDNKENPIFKENKKENEILPKIEAALQETEKKEEPQERGGWSNQWDFLFSCISVSVRNFRNKY